MRVRFRDFDGDGVCELLVSNAEQHVDLSLVETEQRWEPAKFALPEGVSLLNDAAKTTACASSISTATASTTSSSPTTSGTPSISGRRMCGRDLGWKRGLVAPRSRGERTGAERTAAVRARRPHRNNGAWFQDGHLVVQNEDTAKLEGSRRSALVQGADRLRCAAAEVARGVARGDAAAPGFTVELVAAEPLVDRSGRLRMGRATAGCGWSRCATIRSAWTAKGKPGGVIKILEDTDGDGRYDKATPFSRTSLPTGVMPWRNGVLIAAAPDILYAEDTDGDGRADVRRVALHRLQGRQPAASRQRLRVGPRRLDLRRERRQRRQIRAVQRRPRR